MNIIKKINIKIQSIIYFLTNKKIIENYTFEDLFNIKELSLEEDITKKDIENFVFLNKNITIVFRKKYIPLNEKVFFKKLIEIIKQLELHKIKYNIKIYVNDRYAFQESRLLDYVHNLNLTINYMYCDYTKKEFLEEEKYLDKLIKPIKESKLSPYEKYLAIYNKVKQFKPYEDNKEKPLEARSIKYILHNEYMVCVAYAALLENLLNKVGIPVLRVHLEVESSNNQSKTIELEGHQRNIVKIDDNKYNIHGIYIADPTFDNDMNRDLYLNTSITFDRIKEAKKLELINIYDLLLDFHTFKEFHDKINYHLARKINTSVKTQYSDRVIDAYIELYCNILNILSILDYDKFNYFITKYDQKIINERKKYQANISLSSIENIFSDFLTEYYHYIIKLTNKKIDLSSTYKAVRNIKKILDGSKEEKIDKWEYITKKTNNKKQIITFPYVYNPKNQRPNYLTDAPYIPKSKIKNKSIKKLS